MKSVNPQEMTGRDNGESRHSLATDLNRTTWTTDKAGSFAITKCYATCFTIIKAASKYVDAHISLNVRALPENIRMRTVHRSRVDRRKECESCGNARFHGRK
jgi:hypothetical protein